MEIKNTIVAVLNRETTSESLNVTITSAKENDANLMIVEESCFNADNFIEKLEIVINRMEDSGFKGITFVVEDVEDRDNATLRKALDWTDTSDEKVIVVHKSDVLKVSKPMGSVGRNPFDSDIYLKTYGMICQEMMDGYNDFLYSDQSKKHREANIVPVRNSSKDPKIGNNDVCPCGSGKKYKKCCKLK